MAQRYQLVVHLGANALATDLRVYVEGEIQRGATGGQVAHFALWGEDHDLVAEQVQLEVVHEVDGVGAGVFQHFTDAGDPRVQCVAVLVLVLVEVVRSEPHLGDLVHAPTADLHFHPASAGAHHGGVQAFIAVRFRQADPVAQAIGVGLVEVRYNAVHFPAVGLLQFLFAIHDDADGEHIVHLFEGDVFLLHLVVDAMHALWPPFDLVPEAFVVQGFLDRQYEAADEALAHGLALLQLVADVGVGLRFLEAQRVVLQFALDVVEAEAVRKRRVEEERFAGDLQLLVARLVVQRAHVVQAIGEFHQDHAHVLRQREQHLAEVLRLYAVRAELQAADLGEAVDDGGDRGTEEVLDIIEREVCILHRIVQ